MTQDKTADWDGTERRDVMADTELSIKVARLEERLIASEKALILAEHALTSWQVSSNNWRQALSDQQGKFVTLDTVLAIATAAIALATIIFRFVPH